MDSHADNLGNKIEDSSPDGYLPSFSIKLREQGDSEANFRTENDPEDPDQRSNVIQRRGIFYTDCSCIDIVHGYYSADSDELCSVMVLKFRFEPLEANHRIKKAEIQVTFSPKNQGEPEPVIDKMYPEGHFSVQPTTQHETVSTSGGGTIGANAVGVEVGAEFKHEKKVEQDASDATTVQGFILTEGRNYGKPNSVWWTLRENQTNKTGVPTSMQAAILVKRQGMSKFQAHFTVKIFPNWLAAALSFMKSDPKDDPVTFDPRRASTNKLQVYDTDELGKPEKLKLEDLSDVTVTTIYKDAIKERSGKETPKPEHE